MIKEQTTTSPIWGNADRDETVQPAEEKTQEDIVNVHNHPKGEAREMENSKEQLFSAVSTDRRRGNVHQQKDGKLHLHTRKIFFYCEDDQTVEHFAQDLKCLHRWRY